MTNKSAKAIFSLCTIPPSFEKVQSNLFEQNRLRQSGLQWVMENELKKNSIKQLDYQTVWVLEQIPYFTAYIVGFVLRIKKSENYKLPFSRSSLMLKYETRFTCRPGFKLPHLHNRRNLNKHIYISTNSTNRVQVNFAFTCDGHVIDICAAPASETEMMKCLHRWEFHGHIWKHNKQNISLRLRTTWQASNHPIWRLLSSLF